MSTSVPGNKIENAYKGVAYTVMTSEGPYGGFIVRFQLSGSNHWTGLPGRSRTAELGIDEGERAARLAIDANTRLVGR